MTTHGFASRGGSHHLATPRRAMVDPSVDKLEVQKGFGIDPGGVRAYLATPRASVSLVDGPIRLNSSV